MALATRRWAAQLLHCWFHKLRPADWWGGSPFVDRLLRERFAQPLAMLSCQPSRRFLDDPQMALAGVLLFDQVPRNIFRDTPRAFAFDPLARAIAHGALDRGLARRLASDTQRQFLAMPLMHSEEIADQRRSLAVYRALGPGNGLAFARSHYRMIARFGRYPHRNAILGRTGSAAERRAIEAGFSW